MKMVIFEQINIARGKYTFLKAMKNKKRIYY